MEQQKLEQAIEELKSLQPIQIKGKSYTTVANRISVFRRHFTNYSIITNILHDDEIRVVVQAKITTPDGVVIATGLAEEFRGENFINTTSALENGETSSIGRALACLSLGGSEYASAFEVTNAISQQQQNHNNQPINNRNQINQENSNYSPNNQAMHNQQNQTSYVNQQDFQQLTNIGLQIVEKGDMITVKGDKSTIISNKELLKTMGFRFDFNGTKEWYILLRQAA